MLKFLSLNVYTVAVKRFLKHGQPFPTHEHPRLGSLHVCDEHAVQVPGVRLLRALMLQWKQYVVMANLKHLIYKL